MSVERGTYIPCIGLMGNIVDGIQRPLRVRPIFALDTSACTSLPLRLFKNSRNPYIFLVESTLKRLIAHCSGNSLPPTSRCVSVLIPKQSARALLSFTLSSQVGDHVSGGDIFGRVYENSLVDAHKIMLSPKAMGTITHIAEKGSYAVDVRPVSGMFNAISFI